MASVVFPPSTATPPVIISASQTTPQAISVNTITTVVSQSLNPGTYFISARISVKFPAGSATLSTGSSSLWKGGISTSPTTFDVSDFASPAMHCKDNSIIRATAPNSSANFYFVDFDMVRLMEISSTSTIYINVLYPILSSGSSLEAVASLQALQF
jgi:hypothetical protein